MVTEYVFYLMDTIQTEAKTKRLPVPHAWRWRIEKHPDGDRLLVATDGNDNTQYAVVIATPDTLVPMDEVVANALAQRSLLESTRHGRR